MGKTTDYAPGLPEKGKITPLPKVKNPEAWEFSAHPHEAERAGRHIDIRLGNPKTGIAHSFVLPKAELPQPGKSRLVIPTSDHTVGYMDFSGEITEGYGKGTVIPGQRTVAEVYHTDSSDQAGTKLRFNLYEGATPQEYSIRKDDEGRWFLHNKTLTRERRPDIPSSKPKYKEFNINELDITKDQVMMPKLDGAHTLIELSAGRSPRLYSYRVGKKSETGLIEHTHKMPELLKTKVPKELDGTILRGETVAIDSKGSALPAEQIGGLLNSRVWESRKKQEEQNVRLKAFPFQVEQYKGRSMSDVPFEEQEKILKKVVKLLPDLTLPDIAKTPEEKLELANKIKADLYPLTREGVILTTPGRAPQRFHKGKVTPDFDVYVRKIHAARKKDGGEHERAGAISYSWSPDGPIVGQLGGFKHEEASAMLKDPDKYVGRVAKVRAMKVFKDEDNLGALFQPRFTGWHLDKGDIEKRARLENSDLRPGTKSTQDLKEFLRHVKPGDIIATKPNEGGDYWVPKLIRTWQKIKDQPTPRWTHTGVVTEDGRLAHSFAPIKGNKIMPSTDVAQVRVHQIPTMVNIGADLYLLRPTAPKKDRDEAAARIVDLVGAKFDTLGILRAGLSPRRKDPESVPAKLICTGSTSLSYPNLTFHKDKSRYDLMPAEVVNSPVVKPIIAYSKDKDGVEKRARLILCAKAWAKTAAEPPDDHDPVAGALLGLGGLVVGGTAGQLAASPLGQGMGSKIKMTPQEVTDLIDRLRANKAKISVRDTLFAHEAHVVPEVVGKTMRHHITTPTKHSPELLAHELGHITAQHSIET